MLVRAKDGSKGFDFEGTYTRVVLHRIIEYRMSDGREGKVAFVEQPGGVVVQETFDAETEAADLPPRRADVVARVASENSPELQRTGWQAILNNFGRYVEAQK